ncbi:bacteriophage tail protein [Ameyamaea chiangmaiensis NBRC 103196]|uniref:Phage tail protein n=1 Tax=Ameyamaea chiangmaiensis TaxID=442969 RepID=A0A850P5B2_9PROT|nr:phage tail protein [Ameyamaea chiangmaiensis]MBS4075474.1 phage tail protein [Ameyamaea chiangmaiensis]NVN38994.1 phage tail protein [Ameyamaea chiangmaiensis]GBQ69636.1 bacteriophage tail protein [Ameyamaea chiangmaiensis NBRC 103196]
MSDTVSEFLNTAGKALGISAQPADQVQMVVGGYVISGWEQITINCAIDRTPWSAELVLTEYQPDPGRTAMIRSGAAASVSVGGKLMITGYVETVQRSVRDGTHFLAVMMKSKSMDLVDCSAKFSTYQMNDTNVLKIMKKVCAFAGIDVIAASGLARDSVPQFNVILTETPFEICDRLTRLAAVVFYDRPDGNLTVARVGVSGMASGFVEGQNIEAYQDIESTVERHSAITALLQTTYAIRVAPDEKDLRAQMAHITIIGPAEDPGITRDRPLLIPCEAADGGLAITKQRIQWEVNRRYGRSQRVDLTTDSWFDSAGEMWGINRIVPVTIPSAGRQMDMLIASVTFRKGHDGTHADLSLFPPQAFDVEPLVMPSQNPVLNQTLGYSPT